MVGSEGLGVHIPRSVTDLTGAADQGETGNSLDFALDGEGFFSVQTPSGCVHARRPVRGGRAGPSDHGHRRPVLGTDGKPIAVATGGTVDPRQLAVVNLANPRKQGDNLVTGTPQGTATGVAQAGVWRLGADPARAMVDMIASMRTYESGQKVIQTIDETLQKAANSVGNTNGA